MDAIDTRRTAPVSALAAAVVLAIAACADPAPVAPDAEPSLGRLGAVAAAGAATHNQTLAVLRRATARYHRVEAAEADGFFRLTECEERPGVGGIGVVYVHLGRFLDGVLDPSLPDALLYEPKSDGFRLVGVEMVVPDVGQTEPPRFLGVELGEEEEFAAWGIHVWVWSHNPLGMFAVGNPRVSCGDEG